MPGDPRDTPAMRQYARFKQRHPECVLLFRMGDFYETFDDDAVTCHKALGLTLTQRTEGVPMAGIPYHQLENYLRRLIAQGFRVAVADQIQDPKDAKGIVERAVTRVLTPGTLVDEALLDDSQSTRIACVAPVDLRAAAGAGPDVTLGVAMVELSTGVVTVLDCPGSRLADELAARGVRELLYPAADAVVPPVIKRALDVLQVAGTPRPPWQFRRAEATQAALEQYAVSTLAGFGLRDDDAAVPAIGALVRYLKETQAPSDDHGQGPAINVGSSKAAVLTRRATLAHLRPPRREAPGGRCVLDAVSLRSLEVERTLRAASASTAGDGSLAGLFLAAPSTPLTPMGKRLVREWLCRPLGELAPIQARHRAVAQLVSDGKLGETLGASLDGVQDVARIAGRIALGRATPRDLVALGRSVSRLEAIAAVVDGAPALARARQELERVRGELEPVGREVLAACVDAPPAHLREGGLIRDGVDAELDEARLLQKDAGAWLAQYQAKLAIEHNLPAVKVGFNKIFGYYIELSAAQARSAPAVFARKQTLKNAERYTTPELKAFEDKVTTAEARAVAREQALFDGLCERAARAIPAIGAFADQVAELDALLCFARRAARRGWVAPEITDERVLEASQARHPVLEEMLGDRFVPNDVELGGGDRAGLCLITGPNMAGKSTFIRTAALVVLLAHAGSFVPAASARVGLTDRIFTRVGADDALHAGQSTFMVEMIETATILNNVTERSVVILDEIGRGTSTLDGLSLAWAVAEFLGEGTGGTGTEARRHGGTKEESKGPRTLFATHYHELTELEERLPGRVRNLHVLVKEWGEDIVFVHRIVPGRTSQSYGVHVARLAGIPRAVTERAGEILSALSVQHHGVGGDREVEVPKRAEPRDGQLGLFMEYIEHPAVAELREIKLEALSPMQAFDELRRLRSMAREE